MIDDRSPLIRVRVKGPGKSKPELVRLDDFDAPDGSATGSENRVIGWSFHDVEKGASKGKLELKNYDLRFPDDPLFDRGTLVYVAWGYAGDMSLEHELVVVNWTPGPTFTVDLLDRATVMNKLPVDATYDGLTYAGIIRQIAQRNGYALSELDVEETNVIVESVTQNNRTDWQMIAELARELRYLFYVDGLGLHVHSRRLGQKPRIAYTYFGKDDARGGMLAYPSFEAAPAAQPGSVTLKGTDPLTKKKIEVTADNASTAGRPGIATVVEVWDKTDGSSSLRTSVASATTAPTTAATEAQAKTKADGLYKSGQLPMKCTLSVVGEPKLRAKSTIEMRGIGKRLSGVYYVAEISHDVKPGAFTQGLKLRRDGTNGLGGAVPPPASLAKPNGQKGPDAVDTALVPVDHYDPATGVTTTTYEAPK